jgi:hypothetical protein
MLQLRDEHMRRFDAYMHSSLVGRLCEHLRQGGHETLTDWTDERLHSFTESAISIARRFQFQYEQDITAWVELSIAHPELLSDAPPDPINEILTWPSRPGRRKIELLAAFFESADVEASR